MSARPRRSPFPVTVRDAMAATGSAATCVPVELDGGKPEAALFLSLGGADNRQERRLLDRWNGPLALGLETDVITTHAGTVVMLRPELSLGPSEPLAFEILLTPGNGGTHFECLQLLAAQPRLTWFFGDSDYRVIRTQQHPLGDEQHTEFARLRAEALTHDAMVRMTARYDANESLAAVVQHYALRDDTAPQA